MAQRAHRTISREGPIGVIASWEEFEQFLFANPENKWELYEGIPRAKPGMSAEYNEAMTYLLVSLANQLDRRAYRVRSNSAHVQRSTKSYYIPDVFVVSADAVRRRLGQPDRLEMFDLPLLLVIELWSKSTGRYDANTKIPEYRERGDLEIWRLHPYERTLTIWRRQEDGTYEDAEYQGGKISPAFLPNVAIDLDVLFDFA
jgi:Uma2 family endonuclease